MASEEKIDVPFIRDAWASTDFGDVTYELPSCHPLYLIPGLGEGDGNHTV